MDSGFCFPCTQGNFESFANLRLYSSTLFKQLNGLLYKEEFVFCPSSPIAFNSYHPIYLAVIIEIMLQTGAKAVLLLTIFLLHHAYSTPVAHPATTKFGLCSTERLVSDAGCHCFIAYKTNMFPGQMQQYCHEGFGTDLNQLSNFCDTYQDGKGSLDVVRYTKSLQKTQRECFESGAQGPVMRQFARKPNPYGFVYQPPKPNPLGFKFHPVSPFNRFKGIPGMKGNPIKVGGINLTWAPVAVSGSFGTVGLGYSRKNKAVMVNYKYNF